ncbi:hypothetical protein BDV18DRAFT_134491 [Aspergillus unguis]
MNGSSVVPLRELSKLKTLFVDSKWDEMTIRGFRDDHPQSLVSGMPDLRQIVLHNCLSDALTTKSLIALAENRPLLRSINITLLNIDALALQSYTAPMFPQIRQLMFYWVQPESQEPEELGDPTKHALILAFHFPIITKLGCRYWGFTKIISRQFTKSVRDAWKGYRKAQSKPTEEGWQLMERISKKIFSCQVVYR